MKTIQQVFEDIHRGLECACYECGKLFPGSKVMVMGDEGGLVVLCETCFEKSKDKYFSVLTHAPKNIC